MMNEKPFPCQWCDAGDEPILLDEHGVKYSVSGKPGLWCHVADDGWWSCHRMGVEEHAIVAKLPATKDAAWVVPGDPVWRIDSYGQIEERVVMWEPPGHPQRAGYSAGFGLTTLRIEIEDCYSTRQAAEAAQ